MNRRRQKRTSKIDPPPDSRDRAGVVQVGFPGREGVSSGRWDGTARASKATPWIPTGLSFWELSVCRKPGSKADAVFDFIEGFYCESQALNRPPNRGNSIPSLTRSDRQ